MDTDTTTLPEGCYVDGWHGHYANAAVVRVMRALGWPAPAHVGDVADAYYAAMGGGSTDEADALARAHGLGWNAADALAWATDVATAWGETMVPAGRWLGWLDGDYGCWLDEEQEG